MFANEIRQNRNTIVKMRRTRSTVLALVTVCALTAASVSTAGAADQSRSDLFERVQDRVLTYAYFTIFDDVAISLAEEGTVRLTGSVTDERKQRELEERVLDLDGVVGVVNRLTVLPASKFDDRLRYRIARAIYGNPNFWRYGAGANPPIHIVVDHGHVTLTGVVVSEVDRKQARALAGQFSAFSITNNLRLPAEVRAELERL